MRLLVISFLAVALLPFSLKGQDSHTRQTSMLGYSGLIFTPSAFSYEDRQAVLQTSFVPEELVPLTYTGIEGRGLNYFSANLGFLPFLEVSGRISTPQGGFGRYGVGDRSFSAKLRVLSERKNIPALAIGINDIASNSGGTRFYHAAYIVAGKTVLDTDAWTIQSHLGYGDELINSRNQILQGVFGGVSAQWKMIQAKVEYDASTLNAGLGAILWKERLEFQAILIDQQYFVGSASFSFKI